MVNLSNHHVHQHSCQDYREKSKLEARCPVSIHAGEEHFSNHCLKENQSTGVQTMAAWVLLKQNWEEVSHSKNEDQSKQTPNKKACQADTDELDKWPKSSSYFEREERAEKRDSRAESYKIRLKDVECPKKLSELSGWSSIPFEIEFLLSHRR